MLKVKILSPFRYEYQDKVLWLTTGEYYHLDQETDKDEIKFLLSPTFGYKQYIHLDEAELDASFKKEVAAEQEAVQTEAELQAKEQEGLEKAKAEEEAQAREDAMLAPPQDSEPNPFVDSPDPAVVEAESVPLSSDPEPMESAEEAPAEPEAGAEPEPAKAEVAPVSARAQREQELQAMHWTKIKDVAEQYEIEYTEKRETIEAILLVEYP